MAGNHDDRAETGFERLRDLVDQLAARGFDRGRAFLEPDRARLKQAFDIFLAVQGTEHRAIVRTMQRQRWNGRGALELRLDAPADLAAAPLRAVLLLQDAATGRIHQARQWLPGELDGSV